MSYYPDPVVPIKNLKVPNLTLKEKKFLSALIILGFCSITIFLAWYFKNHEKGHPILFYPFTFSVIYLVSRIFFEWYNFLGIQISETPELTKQYKVDLLTTFCAGEPYRMVETTLLAMKNIRYPFKTIYLCDEADDVRLRVFCRQHGIVHVTRKDKTGAKAGNINNALKSATGDICVIMDPDHVPVPEFLERSLPYFDDPKVGYVQCCQGYYNYEESPVARGASEQTYHFYGPQMMGMGYYGTAQAIGANCTFRREALDSIGGHSFGLAEDMHTSMNLQAKGWKPVYIPEMLSRGLVPADITAYYKQQLKWARGSFELLFERYPLLVKKFSWRQRFHHLMTPLFYLNGLTSFILLCLPVLSLFMSDVPVYLDFMEFLSFFLPVLGLQLIIRQYVQKWLYRPSERGFHLTGGVLQIVTWWIFLAGFVYSIIRKKVPYIPTPKEGQIKNFFKLMLPNIIIIIASILAIVYGTSRDWSPFSQTMSFFAVLNIFILSYFCLMCQQKWLQQVENFFRKKQYLYWLEYNYNLLTFRFSQHVYSFLRNGAVFFSILFFGFSFINNVNNDGSALKLAKEEESKVIDYGSFLVGVESRETVAGLSDNVFIHEILITNPDTIFHPGISDELLTKELDRIPFLKVRFDTSKYSSSQIVQMISSGKTDHIFTALANSISNYKGPVFISPFSMHVENISREDAEIFISAWQRVALLFYQKGLGNSILTLSVSSLRTLKFLFPGKDYIDWILIDQSTSGSPKEYYSFLKSIGKPVFCTVNAGDTTKSLTKQLEEIQYLGDLTKGLIIKSPKGLYVKDEVFRDFISKNEKSSSSIFKASAGTDNLKPFEFQFAKSLKVSGDNQSLIRNHKPFFIKGLSYNVTHDWRDPQLALTRKALERDFSMIKELGANTIRRYGTSMYDQNILNIAHEYDLAVIYGFWLEAETDYLSEASLKKYKEEILSVVRQYKDHKAILAWTIGNETWATLKYNYGEPYLTMQRLAYLNFMEEVAQEVKIIDPVHPVFTAVELNESQIAEELTALTKHVPSIDGIGINAYYEEQIVQLDSILKNYYPDKVTFISEFGPRGYWHPGYSKFEQGGLLSEDSDQEKANLYATQWNNYILTRKGKTLGGVAYSWTDRLEGTFTWYGITDFKGRKKAAFYALQEAWTISNTNVIPEMHGVSIETDDFLLVPGRKYTFRAKYTGSKTAKLSYEWYLKKANYLDDVQEALTPIEDGKKITLKVPLEKSAYRLYLFVSDQKGNVACASRPLNTDYGIMERLMP